MKSTTIVVITALVAFGVMATGAVLLIGNSSQATEHLGLLFALFGTMIPSLVALLHAAKASSNTNGALDDRMEAAFYRAQNVRRKEVIAERVDEDPSI